MKRVGPRAFADLERAAKRDGWTVEITRGSHVRFRSPEGRSVFTAFTPSDRRAVLNLRAELRRAGLSV